MTTIHPPVATVGGPNDRVTDAELDRFVAESFAGLDVDGKNVVLIVPDATRSCPLPLIVSTVHRHLIDRVASLRCVIALGTHSYMEPDEIERWFGVDPGELDAAYPGMPIVNHEWADPEQIVRVGTLTAEQIKELSNGAMEQSVDVEINRYVVEADVNIVLGPVFPHEVVGISGGNKYFIPGCATHEAIDLSHWVGALTGVEDMIGKRGVTPVRAIINAGSEMIPGARLAVSMVVQSGSGELEFAAFGTSEESWAAAADVAAESHIVYVDEPFTRVLAMMPTRYDDIWTAAKGCYKTQPAMADGGEVVIYAPHVTEISETHPEIYDIGYHCIEYFTKQREKFADVPKGVLAHSTHVRGAGTYDPETGVEHNRIKVTLATQIPPDVCERVNLGYLDPKKINLERWEADPDVTVQPNAGEILYRLKSER